MNTDEIRVSVDSGQSSSPDETPPLLNQETVEGDVSDEKTPYSRIIYGVPDRLREVNKEAYVPKVISIGPYHHGRPQLEEMESIKKSFFDRAVGESKENTEELNDPTKAKEVKLLDMLQKQKAKENLLEAIKNEEEDIRKCYVELFNLSSEQFVEMVVVDGFFIVQLFRGFYPIEELFRRRYIQTGIMHDLLLLENQLPFFVLVKLYGIMTQNGKIVTKDEMTEEFTKIALSFYEPLIGFDSVLYRGLHGTLKNVQHLLSLIYDTQTWLLVPNLYESRLSRIDIDRRFKKRKFVSKQLDKRIWNPYLKFIRCATELKDAGIAFERRYAERECCATLEIEFKRQYRKPKLRIPTLVVDDNTERMFRNLIAFEQLLPPSHPTYMFDYVKFLDLLINTDKDVQMLCYSGIIENMLGRDYKAVADIFNRLCDNAHGSAHFYYSDVFEKVDGHCHSRWNRHMAYLRRNYFTSGWALLSFLAAIVLLFLTMAQTIFAFMSSDCAYCWVVFTVFVVLFLVIALFCFLLFGGR